MPKRRAHTVESARRNPAKSSGIRLPPDRAVSRIARELAFEDGSPHSRVRPWWRPACSQPPCPITAAQVGLVILRLRVLDLRNRVRNVTRVARTRGAFTSGTTANHSPGQSQGTKYCKLTSEGSRAPVKNSSVESHVFLADKDPLHGWATLFTQGTWPDAKLRPKLSLAFLAGLTVRPGFRAGGRTGARGRSARRSCETAGRRAAP